MLPLAAFAGQLTLTNGDTLTGRLLEPEAGFVVFESDLLGVIKIPADKVVSAPAPKADAQTDAEAALAADGAHMKPPAAPSGAVAEASPPQAADPVSQQELEVAHAELARAEADKRVAQLRAETAEAQLAVAQTKAEVHQAEAELNTYESFQRAYEQFKELADDNAIVRFLESSRDHFHGWIPEGWSGRINFAMSVLRTQRERRDVDVRGRLRRQWERLRLQMDGYYDFRETEFDDRTVRKNIDRYGGSGGLRYDLTERIFSDYTVRYERDMVRDIDHDLDQQLGLGYRVFNGDDLELSIIPTAILTFRQTQNPDQPEVWGSLIGVSTELRYRINRILSIEQDSYYRYNPDDDLQYLYGLEAKLIFKVTKWIDAVARYQTEFDNRIITNGNKDEERIVFSLGVSF
jgi:hypothetical protein